MAASFQEAVVDVLATKPRRAAVEYGAKGICLVGGVAANSVLRERILDACIAEGLRGFLPSRAMCTDNAAMVAAAGWYPTRYCVRYDKAEDAHLVTLEGLVYRTAG